MQLHDYARERLFAPLGITDTEWVLGSNGEPAAASGLRMRPRDLARIGQLVLDRGRFGDRQLVPAAWLDASFEPRVPSEADLAYGYQWWLWPREARADGRRWMGAFGNGGQRLTIMPHLDLVLVVTAGNYNQPDAWQLPVTIISRDPDPGPAALSAWRDLLSGGRAMTHPVLTSGRVAVVTGAAMGIGLAACRRFAALGMKVCMADVDAAELQAARARSPG